MSGFIFKKMQKKKKIQNQLIPSNISRLNQDSYHLLLAAGYTASHAS